MSTQPPSQDDDGLNLSQLCWRSSPPVRAIGRRLLYLWESWSWVGVCRCLRLYACTIWAFGNGIDGFWQRI